jgi:hypothetical protein
MAIADELNDQLESILQEGLEHRLAMRVRFPSPALSG